MAESTYWTRGFNRSFSRRGLMRAGGVAGVGLAGAALIGCGDDDDDGTPAPGTPDANGTPDTTPVAGTPTNGHERQGGTLPSHSAEPADNHNPVTNTWEGHSLSGEHVYDRPIASRPDERIFVLEAAEEVETPDDLTVIFRLKEGMVYQDIAPVNGRDVEAEDIVQMQLYAAEEPQSHNNAFQRFSMDTVEAPDDRTVVWTLQRPNAYLFTSQHMGYAGNMAIVPRELHDDINTMEPIGSGPYMLDSYQFGVRYEYVRNPTYRDADQGLPYVDRRIRLPMSDSSAIETAFRGGQSMIWGQMGAAVPADTAERLISDMGDRLDVTDYESLGPFTLNMSSRRELWQDERIREAMYRIFQPEPFIDLVLSGRGVTVPGALPISLELYAVDWGDELPSGRTLEEAKRHDSDEAIALLEAAGFDFEQTYELTTIAGAINETALQVWEDQLRQHGISNLTYKVMPFGEWVDAISNTGDYDFCITGHPSEDNPSRAFRLNHSDTGFIHQSFNIGDPEIDEMIEAQEIETDQDALIELVKNIQYELVDRHAHMFYIYTAQNQELRHAEIQDWEFNPALQVMHRPEVWLDI